MVAELKRVMREYEAGRHHRRMEWEEAERGDFPGDYEPDPNVEAMVPQ